MKTAYPYLLVGAVFGLLAGCSPSKKEIAADPTDQPRSHAVCSGCFDPYKWCISLCGGLDKVAYYDNGGALTAAICLDGTVFRNKYADLCKNHLGLLRTSRPGRVVGRCECDNGVKESREVEGGYELNTADGHESVGSDPEPEKPWDDAKGALDQ